MAVTEEEEEQQQNKEKLKKKNKNKKFVGLASADDATVKRVIAAAHKGRIVALKRMKAESGDVPLKMGLAVLDKATRHRIAKMGGEVVKARYGAEFYREIGKRSGAVKESYSVEYFADLAAKRKKDKKKNKKNKDKT